MSGPLRMQVLRYGYYETRSQDNRMRVQVMPPVRGLIYDRNGVVLAEKIRETLQSTPVPIKNTSLTITASFGVAQIHLENGLNNALSLADKALYRAKENGRNKVLSASSLAP